MSTNPVSFRLPFESQMAKLSPEHQHIIRTTWNAITDLQGAVPLLKSQIDTAQKTATTASTTAGTSTTSETVIISTSNIGMVNDQTSQTAYTSQQSDYGAFVLLGDTSPVAVTLNTAGTSPGIVLPWFAIFLNTNTGLATLTPATGTISYPNNPAAASMPVSEGQAAIVVFDGTNFEAEIICVPPQDTPAVSHEWIDAYSANSGIFSQTQPAFTDISGIATTAQIGTGTPAAGDYVDGGTGAWTPLPAASLSGTTGSMGGSPMTVGQTITATATVTGATTAMVALCSPATYPGDGFDWDSYVSAADTVTARLTCVLAGTPAASVYNVRVLQ